ncbi:MAG: MerR family transcriptional regulator [Chloroflexi bacterium]|nr:MerR family transcriptional regulator [Chloroflexota bacterium]
MFKIGEFSKIAQVTVKTLRYYDQVDLLKPAQIDRFSDYRYYTLDQLPRLNRILAFKDLGFSLDEIARLLDENVSAEQLRGMLRLKQAEAQQRVADEQARLARIEARLQMIEQEGKMPSHEMIVKKVDALRVAAIRRTIPTYAEQGPLWGALEEYLAQQHITPNGPCLTIYYDTEYRERDVDVEACEPAPNNAASSNGVTVYTLAAVETMATVLHRGGFENVGETYGALLAWIEKNGYRIVGPNREVYLRAFVDMPGAAPYPSEYITTNPAERLTEIQFPVEKV